MGADLAAARETAGFLLRGDRGRWLHSQSAAMAASEAAITVAEGDREFLIATAWLHDVGYAHPHPPTGFHPLDGAFLLLGDGWPRRLAALVAHHSEARFAAEARGLSGELRAFEREVGPVADALVYADMTAGPAGERMLVTERLDDIRRRHAQASPALRAARRAREPFLVLAAARVDQRLLRLPGRHRLAFPKPSAGSTEVHARLVAAHPGRSVLDVRAAVHATLGILGTATRPPDLQRYAHWLLDATALRVPTSTLRQPRGLATAVATRSAEVVALRAD